MNEDTLLSIEKFAALTGISRYKLKRLNDSGKLKWVFQTKNKKRFYTNYQIEEAKKFQRQRKFIEGSYNLIDEKGVHLSEFNAYLAGLFYADGSLYQYDGFGIQLKDKELLDDIAKNFEPKLDVSPHKTRPMWSIYVPSNYCRFHFSGMNFVFRKTYGFDIPMMTKETFRHCLRGWFDGDGSASIRTKGKCKGKVRFALTGHKKMLGCIQKTLFESFDVYIPISTTSASSDEFINLETGTYVTLSQLFDILYMNESICLKRKKEILSEYLKNKSEELTKIRRSCYVD